MFKKLILYFCLITGSLSQEIIWYNVSFPPFVITEGKNIGEGTVDKIIKDLYFPRLKDYSHRLKITNINRLMNNLKTRDYVANIILLKNRERESFAYFSKPFDFVISNHLIVSKGNKDRIKPYLDLQGFVDFRKLMESKKLKVAVESGRHYSKEIDEIIKENLSSRNIDLGYGDIVEASSRKLLHERIDAFIEYPDIAYYIIKEKNIGLDFIAIPIRGTEKYNLLRFSFPRTNWGFMMRKKINKIIDEIVFTDSYYNLATRWSKDKEKYIDEFISNMKNNVWD